MKILSTKHCLTRGIQEFEGEDVGDGAMMISSCNCLHGKGREWHTDFDLAAIRANEIRIKKINAMKKAIKSLEEMVFDAVRP